MRSWLPMVFAITAALPLQAQDASPKKLILIAGKPSHPPGMHEFNAGCELLKKCLAGVAGREVPENGVESTVTDEDMAANLDDKGKK